MEPDRGGVSIGWPNRGYTRQLEPMVLLLATLANFAYGEYLFIVAAWEQLTSFYWPTQTGLA
jgi:hypothetical protein